MIALTAASILLNPQTLSFLLQAATDATQIAMDYSSGAITAEQAHVNLVNAGNRQRDAIAAFNQEAGYYTPGPGVTPVSQPQTAIEAGSPPPAKPDPMQKPAAPPPSVSAPAEGTPKPPPQAPSQAAAAAAKGPAPQV